METIVFALDPSHRFLASPIRILCAATPPSAPLLPRAQLARRDSFRARESLLRNSSRAREAPLLRAHAAPSSAYDFLRPPLKQLHKTYCTGAHSLLLAILLLVDVDCNPCVLD